MSLKIETKPAWAVASPALHDAYADFILSRQAMLCSSDTLRWYRVTLDKVIGWMVENGVTSPQEIQARHVRGYLANMAIKGLSDGYIHNNARVIQTFTRFLLQEKYISETVTFQMPSIAEKRMPVLSEEELKKLIAACQTARDKALALLMVDTGLRRAEVCALNWGDVEISSGLVRVVRGKGGKARSVVVGVTTRRSLLAYRRQVDSESDQPLFQTQMGGSNEEKWAAFNSVTHWEQC